MSNLPWAPAYLPRSMGRGALALSGALLSLLVAPLVVGAFGPLIAKRIGTALETRISRADLRPTTHVDGIIVLGGSSTRVAAAVQLAERFADAPVVLSGPGQNEVRLAKAHLRNLRRLYVDKRATTTFENAVFSYDFVAPEPGERWVIVTSAIHMPRAVGAFQAVGMSVTPWPVSDTPTHAETLSRSVWHEVFGLIGYWALGRSSRLFPSHA